jgi:hypothetical protein
MSSVIGVNFATLRRKGSLYISLYFEMALIGHDASSDFEASDNNDLLRRSK